MRIDESLGMDLLGWGPGQRGCRGVAIFHDKAKKIRDKMRYSNLSNNMMISEL
jgi:lantibiotic modifying enzyme